MKVKLNSFHPLVRRPPKKRFHVRYTVPVVKHSPGVMVWSCMSASGCGPIWIMPEKTTINSVIYHAILQEHLQREMARLNYNHFQQDGAPCHSARLVKAWLQAQNISVLAPWPGSSPDLNPIEHMWARLKKEVSILRPTSRGDLIKKIQRVWETKMDAVFRQNLINSMPRRIEAVIKAGGGHIRS